MTVDSEDRLGDNPVRDRLEDLQAAILCLAAALVRSGAVTEQLIHAEAKRLLSTIDAPDEDKETYLKATVALSRFSASTLEQQGRT